jgi:hypothetical protein
VGGSRRDAAGELSCVYFDRYACRRRGQRVGVTVRGNTCSSP